MNYNRSFNFLKNLPRKLNNFYRKNSKFSFRVDNKSKTIKDFDPVTNIDKGFLDTWQLSWQKASC